MRKKWIKIIAALQVVGSVIGIIHVSSLVFKAGSNPLAILLTLVLTSVLASPFVLGFYGGIHLWNEKQKGFTLSIICQVLQIPKIMVGGFMYSFFTGFQIWIGDLQPKFGIWPSFGGSLDFEFGGNKMPFCLGVNLVALAAVIHLLDVRRFYKDEDRSEKGLSNK